MVLKLALTLSVILQFATAIVALSLIKKTRTNIAWWLISIGFLLMAFRRLFELYQVYDTENFFINDLTNSWIGVFISIVMLLSLSFIRRIFNIQKRLDELKKANEAKVFSAIVKTEEKQKQQFSKELHDGLGPLLASVKMSLSAMNHRKSETINSTILKNAEHQIDESIRTVKEISNSLSPHVLNNFGLQKAIKSFIGNLQYIDKPTISFNHNIQDKRFPYNIEVVAYRVVCELFFNTLKHAEAQNIYLDIFYDEHILSIKYMDDGKGFETNDENRETYGMGLTNIQSRVKSVNGSVQIFSAPDQGFNLHIVVNVN